MIAERIEADLKEAMKARKESVVSALRMVRSAVKNKQIDVGHALSDDETQAILKSMVKQYKDALQDFEKSGRTDLADAQRSEITLLEAYLPAQMSDAEIETLVSKAIAETSATRADAGRVVGAVMKAAAGRADGNAVKAVVERLLA